MGKGVGLITDAFFCILVVPKNILKQMNRYRIIKAQIFVYWLSYRLFPEHYCIGRTIDHGIKMVKLGVELKKLNIKNDTL